MKNIILIGIVWLAAISAKCQEIVMKDIATLSDTTPITLTKNGDVVFVNIVQVNGVTSQQLYTRGKLWGTDAFKVLNSVLQLDDNENKILIFKGYTEMPLKASFTTVPLQMHFTLKFYFKDNRYKAELSSIYYKGRPAESEVSNAPDVISDGAMNRKTRAIPKVKTQVRAGTIDKVNALFSDIRRGLIKQSETENKEW